MLNAAVNMSMYCAHLHVYDLECGLVCYNRFKILFQFLWFLFISIGWRHNALSIDGHCLSICHSVCTIHDCKSSIEGPSKLKINRMEAHDMSDLLPRAVSGVVRIDPLRFLARCHTRQLNQAQSVYHILACCIIVLWFIKAPFVYCQILLLCVLSFGCSC